MIASSKKFVVGAIATSLLFPALTATPALANDDVQDNAGSAYGKIVANKGFNSEAREEIRLLSTDELTGDTPRDSSSQSASSIQSDGTLKISSSSSNESLELSLKGTSSSETSGDHASVSSSLQGVSAVARVTDYGMGQIVATLDDSSRNYIDYSVSIPTGKELKKNSDGGISIVDKQTGAEEGSFISPWAIDATGKMLDTDYTVLSDSEIRQTVQLAGAKFPVAADPSVIWWAKTSITCAADLAGFLIPAVNVASKAPKVIKLIKIAQRSEKGVEAIKKIGGIEASAKFIIKYGVNELRANLPSSVRRFIPSSTIPSDKAAAVAGLYSLVKSQFWDALGVGSCISLYKAI